MGLIHPVDLDAWREAHRRRSWRFWRRPEPIAGRLYSAGPAPDLLIAVDNTSATSRAALLDITHALPAERLVILAGTDPTHFLPAAQWRSVPWQAEDPLPSVSTVLVTHAVALGEHAAAHATATGARLLVVQHGIVTPQNPPLPSGCEVATWSASDADFLIGQRDDIVAAHVVGSALLAKARPAQATSDTPIYLGQLHGAELPRAAMARAAADFCQRTGAAYRLHPSEIDIRSRWQHRAWMRGGIELESSGRPLLDLGRPVVAVYSTGVLEAAAAGLPAWVDFPSPPPWLSDLWQRYGMARWGQAPTEVDALRGAQAPVDALAQIMLEGTS